MEALSCPAKQSHADDHRSSAPGAGPQPRAGGRHAVTDRGRDAARKSLRVPARVRRRGRALRPLLAGRGPRPNARGAWRARHPSRRRLAGDLRRRETHWRRCGASCRTGRRRSAIRPSPFPPASDISPTRPPRVGSACRCPTATRWSCRTPCSTCPPPSSSSTTSSRWRASRRCETATPTIESAAWCAALEVPASAEAPAARADGFGPAGARSEGARAVRGRRGSAGRGDPRRRDAPVRARPSLQRSDEADPARDLSVVAADQPLAISLLPRSRTGRSGCGAGRCLAGAARARSWRRGRHPADRRHAAAGGGSGRRRDARGGPACRPEGAGRARHARRPGAQRRRPRRAAGDRRAHRVPRGRALPARHAPRLGGPRHPQAGARRVRRGPRGLPGRHAVRRAEGPSHGGHRRARGRATWAVRRSDRLLQPPRRRVRDHDPLRRDPGRRGDRPCRGRRGGRLSSRSARRPRCHRRRPACSPQWPREAIRESTGLPPRQLRLVHLQPRAADLARRRGGDGGPQRHRDGRGRPRHGAGRHRHLARTVSAGTCRNQR